MVRGVSKAALFGLAVAGFGVAPTPIGLQDIGVLMVPRAAASDFRAPVLGSPFGTIHVALFRFPRPAGADIPDPVGFRLASYKLDDGDVTGSIATEALIEMRERALAFPLVNRAAKGDRLVPSVPPGPQENTQGNSQANPQEKSPETPQEGAEATPSAATLASAASTPVDLPPAADGQVTISDTPVAAAIDADIKRDSPPADAAASRALAPADAADDEDTPAIASARIYFGIEPMGGMLGTMQPWAPDDALDQRGAADAASGETVARKGEVTGQGHHPKSPAQRLGLDTKGRAKAEKCLADAIYFEARGEPVRGQVAVAQVVVNRVFSGYYPDSVCGVVYQNAERHLACQFTFACDGKREKVDEPDAWKRAEEIARNTLDGKLWLPDVGKATHYHAYWVHPWWVHEMRKLDRIGVHTFYRPRNWGDGADAPVWGDAASTTEAVKKL